MCTRQVVPVCLREQDTPAFEALHLLVCVTQTRALAQQRRADILQAKRFRNDPEPVPEEAAAQTTVQSICAALAGLQAAPDQNLHEIRDAVRALRRAVSAGKPHLPSAGSSRSSSMGICHSSAALQYLTSRTPSVMKWIYTTR
jgi:hypothetical protein